MKNQLTLLLVPVLFALTSCGGGGHTPPAASTPTPVQPSTTKNEAKATSYDTGSQVKGAQEAAVFEQLNVVRAKGRHCGETYYPAAPAVTWNGYLAHAARRHAADMAKREYFSHTSPEGQSMRDRVPAAGYKSWSELGENIAAGRGVKTVMDSWLKSPSHCATIMDPNLTEVGIGYVERSGSPYHTYWVQNFGTPE